LQECAGLYYRLVNKIAEIRLQQSSLDDPTPALPKKRRRSSGDARRIENKLGELLSKLDAGTGPITVDSAQLCIAALQHLAVERLERSSKHLEWLNWALMILTVALFVVAFPPFLETLRRWGCF
jgi:hypothetical protein